MLTVCALNYYRSYFFTEFLLPQLEHHALVDEIIISHGRKEKVFDYESTACKIVHRYDYGDINERYGLSRRWLCWQAATNDAVLSVDEDILFSDKVLDQLYAHYQNDPDVIHSLAGRALLPDGGYCNNDVYGDVPIAITGGMIFSKRLGDACLERQHLIDRFVRENTEPLWVGEDIFASLVNVQLSGRLNKAHRLPFRYLDLWGKPGISQYENFGFDRSRISRLATEALCVEAHISKATKAHFGVPQKVTQLAGKVVKRGRRFIRGLGAKACVKPTFFISGSDAMDTNALFEGVLEHPRVLEPSPKAHGYNVTHYEMGEHSYTKAKEERYASQFPFRYDNRYITGEQCAAYFYMPEAWHRLCISFPLTTHAWRVVLVLNDPIERAYTRFVRRYLQERIDSTLFRVWRHTHSALGKTDGLENIDEVDRHADAYAHLKKTEMDVDQTDLAFNQAMEKELWCLEHGLPRLLSGMASAQLRHLFAYDEKDEFKFDDYNACLGGGAYAYWLDYMLRRFGDERVMVVSAADLRERFADTFAHICEFIRVEHCDVEQPPALTNEEERIPLSEHTRARWRGYIDECNARVLERTKNRDVITEWLAKTGNAVARS